MLATDMNANIVNIGVKQGSEERILYELKKTKNIDVAIIFHSEPQNLFLPGCDRDIKLSNLKQQRADYLFAYWDSNFYKNNHSKFLSKFGNPDTFISAMKYYRTYFAEADLQMNRFMGAVIQIDQFCSAKNLKVVHVIDNTTSIQPWFKFSSGIVDMKIKEIIKSNPLDPGEIYVNGTSATGNRLIKDTLLSILANYPK